MTANQALIDFYNLLLEAERAGVVVIEEMLEEVHDPGLKTMLEKFLRDEGTDCKILFDLILDEGGVPGKKTGAFVEKIRALPNLVEKVDLLIRGQEWVAKKIRQQRSLLPVGSPYLKLEAIKVLHEENVDDTLKHQERIFGPMPKKS